MTSKNPTKTYTLTDEDKANIKSLKPATAEELQAIKSAWKDVQQAEQPSPDQTGVWEPDYEALAIHIEKWVYELFGEHKAVEISRDMIAAYRSQQAAAGVVEVRREFLTFAVEMIELLTDEDEGELWTEWTEAYRPEIHAKYLALKELAAAQDQP